MFDPRHNVIHTADGRLAPKSSTSEADVRRIVREALAAGAPSGIVINFHGGLVSESAARETASERLYPLYADRGQAYPIFFIWESGLFEAPFNNLSEIGGEALFQEFVKKAGEWVMRQATKGRTPPPCESTKRIRGKRSRLCENTRFRAARVVSTGNSSTLPLKSRSSDFIASGNIGCRCTTAALSSSSRSNGSNTGSPG